MKRTRLYFINEFPYDKILGLVDNAEKAIEGAESIWVEVYGEKIKKDNKPYKASYDSENEVWLVEGSLPSLYVGGVPYILIQKSDGKVLAVWHSR